jgi:hypothetical protein
MCLLQNGDVLLNGRLFSVDFSENGGEGLFELVEVHQSAAESVGHERNDILAVEVGGHRESGELRFVASCLIERRTDRVNLALADSESEDGFLAVFTALEVESLGALLLDGLDVLKSHSGSDDDCLTSDRDFCHKYVLL